MSYAYNDIKPRDLIVYNDEPHIVVSVHVARKQQGKPTNQTVLKNLFSGKQYPVTFNPRDSIEGAAIEERKLVYIYTAKGEAWFHTQNNPSDRSSLDAESVADELRFLLPKDEVSARFFEDRLIGLKIPVKIDLKVTEAPPNIKGDTSSGGSKTVVLETGHSIVTPLFINLGDVVRVNTEKNEYIERVSKS